MSEGGFSLQFFGLFKAVVLAPRMPRPAQTGIKVNYEPVGSGLGLKRIKDAAVDFGASDMPLKSEELNKLENGAVSAGHWRRGADRKH
jgi:hypothetical protein